MKSAVVIHSGGMDSSICLALAVKEFGKEKVLSLSYTYDQRHSIEVQQAKKICANWGVDHTVISLDCLKEITISSLLSREVPIKEQQGSTPPNTLVVGRNGLMARCGAILAHSLGAHIIYMGIIESPDSNSGYRDCSRDYMDLKQKILRIDLDDPLFEIRTPLVKMTKKQTLYLAHQLGILPFLLEETVSCYEGIRKEGCGQCPACKLRNVSLKEFMHTFDNIRARARTRARAR